MKLILGSASPGRKRVLEKAGYVFDVLTANLDEKAIRSKNYKELPLLLARAKAQVILTKIHEPALLITADQVVVCNRQLREKPETLEEARTFLESYGRYPAQTHVAIVVTNTKTGKQAEGIDSATTYFHPLPSSVIEHILSLGRIMQAAGGFIVDDELFAPYIERIAGERDSVIGLSLRLTKLLIKKVQE